MLVLTPRLGTRAAELLEMPFMLAVTVMAAIWTVRRFAIAADVSRRLGMGLIAFALVSIAELTVLLGQRLTVKEYLTSRDPVSGPVFGLMLIVFAVMPSLVMRKRKSKQSELSRH